MLTPNHQILTVGRSGHGKSLGVLSWAEQEETSPVHILSLDRRIKLLENKKNVTFDSFSPRDGYIKVDNKLQSYLDLGDKLPFKTLCLFGITALIDFLIVDSGNLLGKMSKADKKSFSTGQTIGSLYLPGWADHNYVSEALRQIFYNGLFQLPCNIIVEANVVNAYDSKGNIKGDKILATDKVAEKIPTFFDEIWEFEKSLSANIQNKPKWKVWFRGSLARTSYPKLLEQGSIDFTDKNLYKEVGKYI